MIATDPTYHALKRVHARLGKGPWHVPNEHDITNDEMLGAIIEASDGMYAFDYAGASGQRSTLIQMGAIKAVRNPDRSLTFTKGDFPEPEDTLSWVERENAELLRRHEQDLAMANADHQRRVEAQRMLDAPIIAARHAEFAHQLAEHGGLARAEERLAALEEQVGELVAALAATK